MTVLLVCKKKKTTLLFMYCGVLFYEFEIMHGHSLCVPPFWGEGGVFRSQIQYVVESRTLCLQNRS